MPKEPVSAKLKMTCPADFMGQWQVSEQHRLFLRSVSRLKEVKCVTEFHTFSCSINGAIFPFLKRPGGGHCAQQVKLLEMPVSHTRMAGTQSSLYLCFWSSCLLVQMMSHVLNPSTHSGDPDGLSGSWLYLGSAPAVANLGNKGIDERSLIPYCSSFNVFFFK